jgi:hypothetical protein
MQQLGGNQGDQHMHGTVEVFDFEYDPLDGARVFVRRSPIMAGCLSDREVDANVKLLKDDLDSVAKRMKAEIKRRASKSPFDED